MNFKLVSKGWKELSKELPLLYEDSVVIYKNKGVLDWCVASYYDNAFYTECQFRVELENVVAWTYLEEVRVEV